MYVFYSERNNNSKIFVSMLCKEYPSLRAISIESHPDVVKKAKIRKVPTVVRGDGTRLEGGECKQLMQQAKQKYLDYNRVDTKGASVNTNKRIHTPTDQLEVSRDYNYSLLPNKGLLGQTLQGGEHSITDQSYENSLLEYRKKTSEKRDVLENEISQRSYGDDRMNPIQVQADYSTRL